MAKTKKTTKKAAPKKAVRKAVAKKVIAQKPTNNRLSILLIVLALLVFVMAALSMGR
jgi:hypothetical protein